MSHASSHLSQPDDVRVPQLHVVHNLAAGSKEGAARFATSRAPREQSKQASAAASRKCGTPASEAGAVGACTMPERQQQGAAPAGRLTSRSTYLLMCCSTEVGGRVGSQHGLQASWAAAACREAAFCRPTADHLPPLWLDLPPHLGPPLNELKRDAVVALLIVRQHHKAKGATVEVPDLRQGCARVAGV